VSSSPSTKEQSLFISVTLHETEKGFPVQIIESKDFKDQLMDYFSKEPHAYQHEELFFQR
jgi:hypothetical protein